MVGPSSKAAHLGSIQRRGQVRHDKQKKGYFWIGIFPISLSSEFSLTQWLPTCYLSQVLLHFCDCPHLLLGTRGILRTEPMRFPTQDPGETWNHCIPQLTLGHTTSVIVCKAWPGIYSLSSPKTKPSWLSMLMISSSEGWSGLHGDDLRLGLLGDNYTCDRLQIRFTAQNVQWFSFYTETCPEFVS